MSLNKTGGKTQGLFNSSIVCPHIRSGSTEELLGQLNLGLQSNYSDLLFNPPTPTPLPHTHTHTVRGREKNKGPQCVSLKGRLIVCTQGV